MIEPAATPGAHRTPIAWLPVGSALVAAVTLLAAFSGRYGYHRDELYFRMLRPAWGYVDQPPLTPLVGKASIALFGDSLWAIRIPATACVAVAILLTALATRELGGGRAAQALTAWGGGFAAGTMTFGHILLTATVDLAVWSFVILCVVRALLREQPRWWLAAGAGVGVALYNKHLILLLLIGLAVGLAVVGPRRVLTSGWLWAGVGLALLVGAPNLVYQASHGWPQLDMARALSANKGSDGRAFLIPLQVVFIGPPLIAIVVAGFVALWRRPGWRPVRALAAAYPVMLVIVFATGGQGYYPFGLELFLFAAGSVPTVDWIARGGTARRATVVAAVALNAVVTMAVALPVIPVGTLGDTPVPSMNQAARDQVGWPVYVATVAAVYRDLPDADRAHAVLLAGNYGEAGALDRYGHAYDLPRIYSGQNQLWWYGPPAPDVTVVVAVGLNAGRLATRFDSCTVSAVLHNGTGVSNEEEGRTVSVCRGPRAPWTTLWKGFRHFD